MTLERALQLCHSPLEQSRSHLVKLDRHALKHILKDREDKLTQNAKEIGELKSTVSKTQGELNSKSEQLSDAKKEIVKLKEQLAATVTEAGK